jgi:hypothetical protein
MRPPVVPVAGLAIATLVVGAASSPGQTGGRPGAYLICRTQTAFVARQAPRNCAILPPRASFSEGINLARLHWQHWGETRATATGVGLGFHLPYSHVPARIRAYRLRRDACGTRMLYTRLRVFGRNGAGTVKAQECFGR